MVGHIARGIFIIRDPIDQIALPEQITRVGLLDIEKVYSIYFRESKTVKEFQDRQTALVKDLNRLSEQLYQSDEFLDELLEAISYVAESEGFSLVLNNSKQFSQFFFFYTQEIDITEKVIQELMRRAGKDYSSEG